MRCTAAIIALAFVQFAVAQSPVWGQCGGINWTGPTTCVAGSTCTRLNDWYYQCIPGSSTSTSTSTTTTTTTTTTSTTTTTTTTSTGNPTNTPVSGFVRVSGQKFVVNGQTFINAGTNAYWLAQNSNADIDKAFDDIVSAGLTSVRTWGFNDVTSQQNYGAYYQLWQNGQPTFNTGTYGISRFDYVVQSAKAHGIRLIVPLVNNWQDYGGMDVYVNQLNSGGTHDSFYTNSRIISAYQNYIRNFVGRYANEPTILAWELANEPRCKGSSGSASPSCTTATITQWAGTISAFIKSIDSNHLVAIGDEGFYQGKSGGYPYNANEGIDFDANLQISSVDFGTVHAYPDHWGESGNAQAWGVKWIQDHAASQRTANKPVILEEFGVENNKETVYNAWWNAIITSGLTGWNVWQAGSQLSGGPTHNDGYAIYPGTSVYNEMRSAAAALKARG